MGDQLDNRPVFMIVMGCNGAGKTAWKRANPDQLPLRYFDQDSIAGGIGHWNTEDSRIRTAEHVESEIRKAIGERVSYGIESTYSGRPGRQRVEQAKRAGYRIEGIYLGTNAPEINVERIESRVLARTGHHIDPALVPERYRWSLSNLRQTADQFDQLLLLDNSRDDPPGDPRPVEQCCLESGKVVSRLGDRDMAEWCNVWLTRLEKSRADRARLDEQR